MKPNCSVFSFGVGAAVLVFCSACSPASGADAAPNVLSVEAISTHAARVSGGDALVRITVPEGIGSPRVTLNGADISASFKPGSSSGAFVGLVEGLKPGINQLAVDGSPWEAASRTLTLTNYPITGPISSGPRLEPFVCQTDVFELPDKSTLGPATDADCSAPTRVQHVYMPVGGDAFAPLPSGGALPANVATTTTTAGTTVPFVVRVETGTMNRGIYQNVVLHNPVSDPEPSPFSPPPAWNTRFLVVHGSGCTGGWHRQGSALGVNPLTGPFIARLGEGYAIFTNTLQHPNNSCNAVVAGESAMMGKEHLIETIGEPSFTISMGGSGGAYTSLQIADALPGLIDGVIATSTFPDALSLAMSGMEAHLLRHYFLTAGSTLSDAKKVAISGYMGMKAFEDAANQARRTDPVPGRVDAEGYTSAVWNEAVPEEIRYHPTTNPKGSRATVFDVARNVYGIDAATGFALRPFDNVGVQYGFGALTQGAISMDEFLDLNQGIGGFDRDLNYVAERSIGDGGAIERSYLSGLTLGGGGGLASIPVLDAGNYNEAGGYHYQWFHFAVRERMRRENGHADNHLMWRGRVPPEESWSLMTDWVAAIRSDASNISAREKMAKHRPARAVDGCWSVPTEGAAPKFVAEAQTFGSAPDSACNREYPSYSFTRQVAGGGLDGNVLKCQLRPINPADYPSATPAQLQRMRDIFPGGVCDWSQPGVGQRTVLPWASFGPAPEGLVHDVTRRQ
ncbi:MAG: DUF6351 family protein [Vicinamibacterales bacterium]